MQNLILSIDVRGYDLSEHTLNITRLTQTKFKMKIRPIRNEADYKKALERLEVVFDAKRGTCKGNELVILAILIDSYESENFPIELPDLISAINFRM